MNLDIICNSYSYTFLLLMASLTNGFKYDVFLSFKVDDTASDFAGNLYKALNDRGIRTFMDDDNKKLENREKHFKTIEESKTAIIVLSKNYASSLSCLEQLASILDCMKRKRRLVWPVFYNMGPSDVRSKTRTGKLMGVHKAWSNHYKNRLKKTKKALHQVADLSGFHLNNGYYAVFYLLFCVYICNPKTLKNRVRYLSFSDYIIRTPHKHHFSKEKQF